MSTPKKSVLGKGLSALLEDHHKDLHTHTGEGVHQARGRSASMNLISTDSIETNPFQPRHEFNEDALRELSESIRLQGIIQPITVRMLNANSYQLISGERRLRASKMAGMKEIPAYVRTADDQEMLEMALIENIQREDLNALEIALSFQRMIEECNMKQEQLGERVSKSRSTVTNYLRLLKLPPQIQEGLKEGKISMGHAKVLVSVEHADKQLWMYNQILLHELSVRKTEELGRQTQAEVAARPVGVPPVAPELRKVQDDLSSHLGTRVQIKVNPNKGGKIEIPFLSTHDLNRILELMN